MDNDSPPAAPPASLADAPPPAPRAGALAPLDDIMPPSLDAHGFDPADYDWVPVRRQRERSDGWSHDKQRAFIAALADTGSVREAAREVRMTAKSAYALRRAPDGAGFAAAWEAAIGQAMHCLLDAVTERAIHGVEEPVFDRDGRVIAHRTRHNDRLAMFLLRAHMPERFRLAHRADREAGEPLPPAPPPLAEALALLDPVTPAAPDRLMAPDDLAAAIEVADILDGTMPPWLRDRDLDPPSDPYRSDPDAARMACPDTFMPDFSHWAAERGLAPEPRAEIVDE